MNLDLVQKFAAFPGRLQDGRNADYRDHSTHQDGSRGDRSDPTLLSRSRCPLISASEQRLLKRFPVELRIGNISPKNPASWNGQHPPTSKRLPGSACQGAAVLRALERGPYAHSIPRRG
jgi:hypothetical protein